MATLEHPVSQALDTHIHIHWGRVAATVAGGMAVGFATFTLLGVLAGNVVPEEPPTRTVTVEVDNPACREAALELYRVSYVTLHHYAIPSIDTSVTIDEFEFSQSILAEAEALSRVRFAELTDCAGSDIPFETIDE